MATCKTCVKPATEVDPNKPINPNTGENYPDYYPETLHGLTYGTGRATDIIPSQVDTEHINPNTGVNFTEAEVEAYRRPVDMEWYLANKAAAEAMANSRSSSKSGMPEMPELDKAPEYQPSPEEQAWLDSYGGKLEDWVKNEGYGIPEETQQQMIAGSFDALKAREKEALRVMQNDMERRGITNSGLVFSNSQKIRAATTTNLAQSIRDVQIQSSLMKMASFERAMGQAGEFLGYLSTQSQLKYAPEFANWQMEQESKMMEWQGEMDVYKQQLAACAAMKQIALQGKIQADLAAKQHLWNKELVEMEIQANEKVSFWGGLGQLFGFLFGWLLL